MDKYINCIDAQKALIKLPVDLDAETVQRCIETVHNLPAADVQPVRHGRWEYNPGDNIPYCSECMMPQDGECNFCPNCGADMREANNETP